MKLHSLGSTALACVLVASCNNDTAEPGSEASPKPSGTPVSILRPDVEQPPQKADLAPLTARIGFPEGGAELSEGALAELATVRESPQVAEGGPIVLRGHSDAGGNDEANIRASQARAEAVRDWLVEMGVGEDRITIISFGEQNPVEPNALPDGSPNEAGRAANRRVDITVSLPRAGSKKPDNQQQADSSQSSD
ncbi:OmpA family protein [Altererythrobacter arenosus]|uniref:OmpA family protein n=1 Tax=Altererythrobacter arenosus TaxID=3032592 RepID=A0ABY8FUV2_9SPHN|nr:OmpA family protein [Altererythrobacter sp. CAU 1644]WFL78779.1 OmpA family protein [Altererythrobacter sp. CAU 1644]